MPKTRMISRKWTANDVNQLWNGSLAEVAKLLNRSTASVSVARTAYNHYKPGNSEGLRATDENLYHANRGSAKPAKTKRGLKAGGSKRQPAIGEEQAIKTVPMQFPSQSGFKMVYAGVELLLPQAPKKLHISGEGLELEF